MVVTLSILGSLKLKVTLMNFPSFPFNLRHLLSCLCIGVFVVLLYVCAMFVQVTLCSNTVRTYQLSLVVDVEGVGEEILTLPINARYINMLNVQTYSNKQLLKSFLSQQNESNMSYWAHLHRSLFSISLRLKIFFPLKRET